MIIEEPLKVAQGFDGYAEAAGEPEIYQGMPAAEYHRDAGGPRLSHSLAKLVLQRSPMHVYFASAQLGHAGEYVYTPDAGDGTITHALLLEPENSSLIAEIDAADFRTNAAKEARDRALENGQIPIVSEKLGKHKYKARALRQRLEQHVTRPIVFDGKSEVVIYWTEQTPSGPVRCRCRIDHLREVDGRMQIIDVKTCDSAHRRDVMRRIWQDGYEIQREAYARAVGVMFPAFVGRIDCVFAFCELERPYAVNPIVLSPKFEALGRLRWERARDRWGACLLDDEWPGYPGDDVDPPGWAEAEEFSE